jgi:hypothetical protein
MRRHAAAPPTARSAAHVKGTTNTRERAEPLGSSLPSVIAISVPIIASGLSLATWAVTSHILSTSSAAPAVDVYTIGSVAWLVLGLGIPYLIPVLARADVNSGSSIDTLLLIMCAFSAVVATISTVLACIATSEGVRTVSVGISYAVLLSLSGLLIQRGRVSFKATGGLVAGALLSSPFLPLAWIFLQPFGSLAARTSLLGVLVTVTVYFVVQDVLRKRVVFSSKNISGGASIRLAET